VVGVSGVGSAHQALTRSIPVDLHWLFDASVFITRNHCGTGWTHTLVALNRVANFLIFLSYISIPLSLLYFWLRLRDVARLNALVGGVMPPGVGQRLIVLNFVCFITLCGLTHLCDVLAFEWVPYRLFTCVDILTAAASVPTAIILPGVLRGIVGVLQGENRGGE
jgi:uncharacterized MnhB-related membrane protein